MEKIRVYSLGEDKIIIMWLGLISKEMHEIHGIKDMMINDSTLFN